MVKTEKNWQNYILKVALYWLHTMASLLSNLVNNFAEGINRIKCKYRHEKNVEIKTKIESAVLNKCIRSFIRIKMYILQKELPKKVW